MGVDNHWLGGILPNLRELCSTPNSFLSDLTIYSAEDGGRVDFFQALWALWSPMVRGAMEDLSHPPETMCLIVEGVSTSDLLRLHESLLAPELREDQWRELEPLVALMGVTGPKLVVQDPVPFLSQPVFVCQVCSKEYSSEKRLVQHEEMHNKVEAGTSTTEETTFGRRPRRASNKPRRFQSSEANGFECPSCEAEFESEAARDLHYREHTRQASSYRKKTRGGHFRFRCGICRKNFASKQSLQNHELLHSGQRDFECDLCEKRFVSLTTLKSHRKLHSEDAQHAFPCKHCEKSFQNPSNLARHVRNLHFEFSDCRIFTCSQCQKTFKDPSGLASHLKTHEAKRDFACPDCDKAFLTAAHLRCHTRIHTGERPYECSDCQQRFTTQSQMKSHIRHRHQGVKLKRDNLCGMCGVTFVKTHDLEVHMRKHTGELPFRCALCQKGFRSSRLCEEHTRIHTGQKPYKCETCQHSFRGPGGLRQHFQSNIVCSSKAKPGAYSLKKSSLNANFRHAEALDAQPQKNEQPLNTTIVVVDTHENQIVTFVQAENNVGTIPNGTSGTQHGEEVLTMLRIDTDSVEGYEPRSTAIPHELPE